MAAKKRTVAARAAGRSVPKEAAEQPQRITDATLLVGEYTATQAFRKISRHVAICRPDGSLVAVTGPADELEARLFAELFCVAPMMRKLLEEIERSIQNGAEVELQQVQAVLGLMRKGSIS